MRDTGALRRRSQVGVTLLEVLVSILIFSFGILGMVALQARAVQYSVDAEDRTRAATIANEVVSAMWGQRTLSLPAGTLTPMQTRAADVTAGGLPNGALAVAVSASGVATVTVTWSTPARGAGTYNTQVAMP